MSERYKNLLSISSFWNTGCPLILEKGALLQDTVNGCNVLQLKFKNNVPKKIIAVNIEIIAKDAFMGSEERLQYSYLDIEAEYGDTFGENNAIVLNDTKYREFSFAIKKVLFANKSIYESDETLKQINGAFKSINCLGDYSDTYIREIAKTGYKRGVQYKPSQENEYWKCICGAINEDTYTKCKGCSIEKELILSYLDSTFLYEKQLEYNEEVRQRKQAEEEERKRQQQLEVEIRFEKKKHTNKIIKKVSIIACSVAAVVAVGVLVSRLIYCNIKYNEAAKYIKSGEIAEATNIFETLGTYKDSEEMVSGKVYCAYGDFLFYEKKYEDALSAYNRAGEFAEVEETMTNIYGCKYNIAKQMMENEKYEEALKKFEELENYEDSDLLESECYYQQAEIFLSQEQFQNAVDYYTTCQNREYKENDIKEKIECCNYNLGKQKMFFKNYEEAIEYFEKAETYEDCVELLNECKYKCVIIAALNISRINAEERKVALDYAEELKEINYKEINKYYEEITKWQFKIYVNNSKTSITDMNSINMTWNIFWHYEISGGERDDKIEIKYEIIFPNGDVSVDTFCCTYEGINGYIENSLDSMTVPGTAKITFYNVDTSEVLGADSVVLY